MTKHEQRLTRAVKRLTKEVRQLRIEIESLKVGMPSACIPGVVMTAPDAQPLVDWRDDEAQISPPPRPPKPPAVRPRY